MQRAPILNPCWLHRAWGRISPKMTIDADEIRTAIRPPPPVNESRKTAGWNTDQTLSYGSERPLDLRRVSLTITLDKSRQTRTKWRPCERSDRTRCASLRSFGGPDAARTAVVNYCRDQCCVLLKADWARLGECPARRHRSGVLAGLYIRRGDHLASSCCRDLFEEDRVSSVDDQPADENA